MSRAKRILRRALIGLAALLLLLGVLLTAALHSEFVFREALRMARPLIPGELDYAQISGTLSGPVQVRDAVYDISGTRIRAAALTVDPSPWALLRNRVDLGAITARGLEIRLSEDVPADETEEPRSPREILESLRLPIELHADAIDVRDARLLLGDETLLALDTLRLALGWTESAIAVRELQAQGPALNVTGNVMLGLAEGVQSDLQLHGRWNGAAFPLAAQLEGRGDANVLQLEGSVSEPADAHFDVRLENLLDTPRWRGALHVDEMRPAHVRDGLPDTPWIGRFDFAGNWQDTQVQGHARGEWPIFEAIDAHIDARINAERVAVNELIASIGAFGSRLRASGQLDFAPEIHYSANGSVDRFTWPDQPAFPVRDVRFELTGDAETLEGALHGKAGLHDRAAVDAQGTFAFATQTFDARLDGEHLQFDIDGQQVSAARLEAHAEGTPENYRLAANTNVRYADLPPAHIDAAARGTTETLDIAITRLLWLDGIANGEIAFDWREALQLRGRMDGRGFQLRQLDPDLAVTLGARAGVTARFGVEHPQVQLNIEALEGDLAGLRLRGQGELRLSEQRISTPGLRITAGEAALRLQDAPGDGFDFMLDVPTLADVYAPARGSVRARGWFGGDLQAPDLRIDAEGQSLGWQAFAADMLRLRGELRAGGQRDSNLEVNVRALQTPALAAEQLHLKLRGARVDHSLQLTLDSAPGETSGGLALDVTGGWNGERWQGRIRRLDTRHADLGNWQLDVRAEDDIVITANGALALPEHCLQGPDGRVCAGPLRYDETGWRAAAELREVPLQLFSVWLPVGPDYRGVLNGVLDLKSDVHGVRGAAEVRLGEGSIRQSAADDAAVLLGWNEGTARVNFAGREARGDLNVVLHDGGGITGSGRVSIPETAPMYVDASVRAHTDNLELVPSLLPELSRLSGRFDADLTVRGPLDAPRIRGSANLRDGSARVLALGTDWRNVNIAITGEGREISMTGHAESGEGAIDIELEGRDDGDGFSGRAEISGKDFRALHTPEAEVDISPELRVQLDGRDLYVGGDVNVPYARIKPRDLSTATQPSGDQVIVNAEQRARDEALRVHARITTRLGKDVRVEAFRLNARLDGELTVAQEPGGPPTGLGRLSIAEGDYRAYGQDLNLERGYIIYTGQQIGNPGLDVRATREPVPDITVGVLVRGPLSQPRVTVFAEPPMAETEALSYLLFGRSLNETTGEQASEVNSAALALGLGGQRLLGRVGEKLGVEEVRVEQIGDPDEASLVLGKYLSPDLYVSYGIGLYDAVNTFRVRYRLSSKWTLEATSGIKSSADFVYTIER